MLIRQNCNNKELQKKLERGSKKHKDKQNRGEKNKKDNRKF